MKSEKWNTFGKSCSLNEDRDKGVWWNWNESSKNDSIEHVVMDYLFGKILKSFLDKKCCKEMVMHEKPASYVSPWKTPFGRCNENTNETVSKIKKFADKCRK
jgi:hypothetical protein